MRGTELSAAFVRTAKPGRYSDGDGLYLLVKKSGQLGVFRYKVNGSKLREAGLAAQARAEIAFASLRPARRLRSCSGRSRAALTPWRREIMLGQRPKLRTRMRR